MEVFGDRSVAAFVEGAAASRDDTPWGRYGGGWGSGGTHDTMLYHELRWLWKWAHLDEHERAGAPVELHALDTRFASMRNFLHTVFGPGDGTSIGAACAATMEHVRGVAQARVATQEALRELLAELEQAQGLNWSQVEHRIAQLEQEAMSQFQICTLYRKLP